MLRFGVLPSSPLLSLCYAKEGSLWRFGEGVKERGHGEGMKRVPGGVISGGVVVREVRGAWGCFVGPSMQLLHKC